MLSWFLLVLSTSAFITPSSTSMPLNCFAFHMSYFILYFSIHLLFSRLIVACCGPVPHQPNNMSPSWPLGVSFMRRQEQQRTALMLYPPMDPLAGGIWGANCSGVFQKIINQGVNFRSVVLVTSKEKTPCMTYQNDKNKLCKRSISCGLHHKRGLLSYKSYLGVNNFVVVKI